MIAGLLLLCAAALLATPRLLVRAEGLRRSPRAALLLWQGAALSAVLCLLAVGPVALARPRPYPVAEVQVTVAVIASAASVVVVLRLLGNSYDLGRRIRAARTEHRDLIDLVGRHEGDRTRILPSKRPGAYCLPGTGSRLVITEATRETLPPDQLAAVLAHEEAHLHQRHDLVLEFFTVLHTSTPRLLRPDGALREVALLVELLADRAARTRVGEVALGRAIASLAEATADVGLTPGAGAGAGAAAIRIRLLAVEDPAWWRSPVLHLATAMTLLVPLCLVVLAAAA